MRRLLEWTKYHIRFEQAAEGMGDANRACAGFPNSNDEGEEYFWNSSLLQVRIFKQPATRGLSAIDSGMQMSGGEESAQELHQQRIRSLHE